MAGHTGYIRATTWGWVTMPLTVCDHCCIEQVVPSAMTGLNVNCESCGRSFRVVEHFRRVRGRPLVTADDTLRTLLLLGGLVTVVGLVAALILWAARPPATRSSPTTTPGPLRAAGGASTDKRAMPVSTDPEQLLREIDDLYIRVFDRQADSRNDFRTLANGRELKRRYDAYSGMSVRWRQYATLRRVVGRWRERALIEMDPITVDLATSRRAADRVPLEQLLIGPLLGLPVANRLVVADADWEAGADSSSPGRKGTAAPDSAVLAERSPVPFKFQVPVETWMSTFDAERDRLEVTGQVREVQVAMVFGRVYVVLLANAKFRPADRR